MNIEHELTAFSQEKLEKWNAVFDSKSSVWFPIILSYLKVPQGTKNISIIFGFVEMERFCVNLLLKISFWKF